MDFRARVTTVEMDKWRPPRMVNFVAHPLTARFVAVLKHLYFLSFIPRDIVFYSLHFSLAIFVVRSP